MTSRYVRAVPGDFSPAATSAWKEANQFSDRLGDGHIGRRCRTMVPRIDLCEEPTEVLLGLLIGLGPLTRMVRLGWRRRPVTGSMPASTRSR